MSCGDTDVPPSDRGEELPVDDEFVATDMGFGAENRQRNNKTTAMKKRKIMVVPGPRLEDYAATLGCNRFC